MPTKKPKVQALLTEDIHAKFKMLCEIDGRSESNLAGKIITDFINNYEKKNGCITIGNVINQSGDNNSITINS